MVTKRLRACVAAVLVMLAGGLLGGVAFVFIACVITHSELSGDGGLWYGYFAWVFLLFSPSLLLPYLAVFGRRQTNTPSSLYRAAACAFFYGPSVFYTLGAFHCLDGHHLKDWVVGAGCALIPGVILTLLALLGSYVVRRIRDR